MKKLFIIIVVILIVLYTPHSIPIASELKPYIKTEKLTVVKDYKDLNNLIEVECNEDYEIDIDMSNIDLSKKGIYSTQVTLKTQSMTVYKSIQVEVVDKVVYLTFDDGPSINTQYILDILDRYNIKATFFVTAENTKYSPLIKEAYIKGHTIGLHAFSHDYEVIYSSVNNYFKDLQKISDYVEGLTGIKSRIIRFPGGSSNTISKNYNTGIMSRLTKKVLERGYQYYDWNLSSGDAEKNVVDTHVIIEKSTDSSYLQYDYIMLLMHDSSIKTTTVEALPSIIEYYKEQGYIFKKIEPGSYVSHQNISN